MLHEDGFTLLEIVIVIGILGVLAAAATAFYWNVAQNIQIDLVARAIVFDLKRSQARAMAGEDALKWGVHFINAIDDYYEIFSDVSTYGVSTTVDITNYLPSPYYFTNPSDSSTIIFSRITGTIAATSTVIISDPNGATRTVTVTPLGNIY